jgi:hypothetical protein
VQLQWSMTGRGHKLVLPSTLQAQAGYDSAKGAASDAASTAQGKASEYAEAGQQQASRHTPLLPAHTACPL